MTQKQRMEQGLIYDPTADEIMNEQTGVAQYLKEYNSAENEVEKYLKMLNDDMNDLKNSAPVNYDRIREYETDISYFKNLKNAILSDNVDVLKIETDKMKDNIKINQTKLKDI